MIKRYLLTGLAILLPVAVTIWVVMFLVDILTTPFEGTMRALLNYLSENTIFHDYLIFFSRAFVLIVIVVVTFILGFLGQHFLTRWMIKMVNRIFLRIPIFKSIFRISREITKSFLKQDSKPFKKTVLMDFPDKDIKAYGFQTGIAPQEVQNKRGENEELHSVFLPTAPHPISGYLMMIGKDRLLDVNVSVEEVFKTLVSCGLFVPGEDNGKEEDDEI
ncbi:MAG: DUF502 domain-containing protein [Simkaniaceae bacterium]|nr:DUF502 domain-containing protein [Simkaniaceae bacterium]